MIRLPGFILGAIALTASASLALAQTSGDHASHHAPANEPLQTAQAPVPMQGQGGMVGPGMMGGGMMPMMEEDADAQESGAMTGGRMAGPGAMAGRNTPMMHMMRGMTEMMLGMNQMMQGIPPSGSRTGMMPGGSVEDRIAGLRDELGITQAQLPQWNAFADALRAHAKAMREMRTQMMGQGIAASWPDRIARHERRLTAHLEALKAMEGPTRALWEAFSEEQRRKAGELMGGPMEPMGMMGRM